MHTLHSVYLFIHQWAFGSCEYAAMNMHVQDSGLFIYGFTYPAWPTFFARESYTRDAKVLEWCTELQDGPMISIHLVSCSYVIRSPWVERESGTCSLPTEYGNCDGKVGRCMLCETSSFYSTVIKRFSRWPEVVSGFVGRWPLCRTCVTRNCGQTSHQELRAAPGWQPARKRAPQSYHHMALNSVSNHWSLEKGILPSEKALRRNTAGGYLDCSLVKLWADDLIALTPDPQKC